MGIIVENGLWPREGIQGSFVCHTETEASFNNFSFIYTLLFINISVESLFGCQDESLKLFEQ